MITKWVAALVSLVSFVPAARAQDAASVVKAASQAIGVEALKTVEYSGSGYDFALGQAYTPNAPWPRFIDKTYTRAIDFAVPASRMDRLRLQGENPPRGGGQQPLRGEQPQNQTIIVNANTPWVQQLEIWMLPHAFLRAAAVHHATVKPQTVGGKRYNVLTFAGLNKAPVSAWVGPDNVIDRVETTVDNAVLGDMPFEALYSDYKDYGGIKFPTHIVQKQGGHPVLDITVTEVKPNAAVTIVPPPGGGGAPAGAAPAAPGTPSEKLGDGVYLIAGGYASIAVEMKDHVVVIEGPQSDERAVAVIAETKRLIPGKPIRYVVNTHHHFDHASGLRAFVAEGATVVTHEVNRAYYEKVFAAPHTLSPDTLARAPRAATFETMTEKKVLTDGNQVVELHHLQGTGHNEGLIVAYLPKQKILVEADAFNPPVQPNAPPVLPVSPYTANLVETAGRLKLDFDRIIPIHLPADGRTVRRAELMRAVGQPE